MPAAAPLLDTRRVPRSREAYIEQHGTPCPPRTCTGCFGGPAVASDGVNSYCEPCWAYQHGYDQAEEKVTRAIIGDAVAAALEIGENGPVVTAAIKDAVSDAFQVAADDSDGGA